jgi:prophage antirepressor-like protein
MNLALVKSEMFGKVKCDFWKGQHNEVFMTSFQLGDSLEYSDPQKGIDNLISRNDYLRSEEFSVTLKMRGTDGKLYDTRVFNEDGIYEVTFLAKTQKAKEFRSWVRKILKALRKGDIHIVQPSEYKKQELDIKRMNAEARLINAKVRQAKIIKQSANGKILSQQSVELININAVELLTDSRIEHRPAVKKTYTATEIGTELGISSNMVGRIANANGLKTEEFGMTVLDKSKHSSKQVPTFLYYESGRQRLLELHRGDK